jgi:Arc/MetJ-type ribon-helix-helix transcriptional regulator
MKTNTKSSITLPAAELARVVKLQKALGAASKVDVVRRGLRLLEETTQRAALRRAYADASQRTRSSLLEELGELDGLAAEGLDA